MTGIPCPVCAADTADGLACGKCGDRCRADLLAIARWWPQLDVTLSRQGRGGETGRRTDPSPLPIHAAAYEVASYVRNQLLGWVRELDLGDATTDDGRPLPDEPVAWALWLAARIQRIRGHAAADEICQEWSYCLGLIRRCIDAPAPALWCGACQTCGRDLMAKPGAVEVTCRHCERAGIIALPVDVQATRTAMLAAAEGVLASRHEVLTALPAMYGVRINRGTLDSWISRGHLAPRGDLLLISDVLDVAARMARNAKTTRQAG